MSVYKLDPPRARQVFAERPASRAEVRIALAFKTAASVERLLHEDFDGLVADGHTAREEAAELIAGLISQGVLVPADRAEDLFAAELCSLDCQLDTLAGALTAMSDWGLRTVRVDGEDPEHVLAGARRKLTALRAALDEARTHYIEQQLAALDPPPNNGPLQLHLGCGASRTPGWVDVDMTGGDLRLHLGWRLPFDECTVSAVFSAHTFEHLDYHTTAPRLLAEIHRVLRPGGLLRMAVPDLEAYARAYTTGKAAFFDQYDRKRPEFGSWAGYHTPLAKVMRMAGSAVKPGGFGEHKMGYDFATLSALLEEAGFVDIARSAKGASEHRALQAMDSTSGPAGFSYEDMANTLFVEAAKPAV